MLRQGPLEQCIIEPGDVVGDVLNGVVGNDIEPDVGVPRRGRGRSGDAALRILPGSRLIDGQRRALMPETRTVITLTDGAVGDLLPVVCRAAQRRQKIIQFERPRNLSPRGGWPAGSGCPLRRAEHHHATVRQFLLNAGTSSNPLRIGVEADQPIKLACIATSIKNSYREHSA
jgi:hypothetical protein